MFCHIFEVINAENITSAACHKYIAFVIFWFDYLLIIYICLKKTYPIKANRVFVHRDKRKTQYLANTELKTKLTKVKYQGFKNNTFAQNTVFTVYHILWSNLSCLENIFELYAFIATKCCLYLLKVLSIFGQTVLLFLEWLVLSNVLLS